MVYYAVIKTDLVHEKSIIVKCADTYKDALLHMSEAAITDKDYTNEVWFKREHENDGSISIFALSYFTKKKRIARYEIQEFEHGSDIY